MKSQWIIQCVGTSEEDQAHLRLLLRSARKQVSEDWVWGAESDADLLLMDTHSPIDDAAVRRVSQPGVTSAQLIDAGEPEPAGLFLHKPFQKDAFAALLGVVARRATLDPQPSGDPSPPPAAETIAKSEPAEAANISGAPVVATSAPTGQESQSPQSTENNPRPPLAKAADPNADDEAMRWLLHYLPKRVLGGPAQIALPGAPVLVIDPEARMFWANGSLPALEPYSRQPLRFGDWKRLAGAELEQARKGVDARPYAQLMWMDSFIHSNGSLSRRFDPEGTYRLTKRLDLSNDYPRALRISAQMSNPRRLDAIARASGADLAEVFDVVNAYEAIGYLEWTRPGETPRRT